MILEDDNILFEDVKNSCDFLKLLNEWVEECQTANDIFTPSTKSFIEKLSKITGYYHWAYSPHAISLVDQYNKIIACIGFCIYNYKLREYRAFINIDYNKLPKEFENDLKTIFKLDDKNIWSSELIRNTFINPYTHYRYKL